MRSVLRPCAHPGCPTLVERGRCEKHSSRKLLDAYRGSARERGYDKRWERARLCYLQEHPLCAHCEAEGRVVAATIVDHVIPHRGDQRLFWLPSNWQPLCADCHARKTARENGLAPCSHASLVVSVDGMGAMCALCGSRQDQGGGSSISRTCADGTEGGPRFAGVRDAQPAAAQEMRTEGR